MRGLDAPPERRAMQDVIEAWDGEAVIVSREPRTGSWILIAVHDTRAGPAVGGTRMKSYPTLADAAEDVTRLAAGMTYKWAGVGLPFGGGKAVIATPGAVTGEDRTALLRYYAHRVAALRGLFRTGEDLGTTPEDMETIAAAAPVVMGMDGAHSKDPGPFTALGVYRGMKAAARAAYGSADLAGKRILIQGVGDVGLPLAALLADEGAELLFCDLDAERARHAADRFSGDVVEPDRMLEPDIDIYAPCAVGATLHAESIPRLRCRVVAGSANNQLATEADADRLHERGILYAPDYIVNAGGAIAFGRMTLGETDEDRLRDEVTAIEHSLDGIFREAEAAGETPLAAARRRAHSFLDGAGRAE